MTVVDPQSSVLCGLLLIFFGVEREFFNRAGIKFFDKFLIRAKWVVLIARENKRGVEPGRSKFAKIVRIRRVGVVCEDSITKIGTLRIVKRITVNIFGEIKPLHLVFE